MAGHTSSRGDTVDLPDDRTVHLVVVVGLVVDLNDELGFPDLVEVLQRVAGRVAGVVPAPNAATMMVLWSSGRLGP